MVSGRRTVGPPADEVTTTMLAAEGAPIQAAFKIFIDAFVRRFTDNNFMIDEPQMVQLLDQIAANNGGANNGGVLLGGQTATAFIQARLPHINAANTKVAQGTVYYDSTAVAYIFQALGGPTGHALRVLFQHPGDLQAVKQQLTAESQQARDDNADDYNALVAAGAAFNIQDKFWAQIWAPFWMRATGRTSKDARRHVGHSLASIRKHSSAREACTLKMQRTLQTTQLLLQNALDAPQHANMSAEEMKAMIKDVRDDMADISRIGTADDDEATCLAFRPPEN